MDRFTVEDAWEYYESTRDSIIQRAERTKRSMLTPFTVRDPRFFGMNTAELDEYFAEKLNETDRQACFFLIASAEASLYFDFFGCVYARKRDEVSRKFRSIYKNKRDHDKSRVRLDEDILQTWVETVPDSKSYVGELRGALNYRHWLAHGRWWVPKMGRRYDPAGVLQIITRLFSAIGLSD